MKGVRRKQFRLTDHEKRIRKKANNQKYRPTKEQNRAYLKAWREKNKERQAEINRRAKQKKKEAELKRYLKQIKYERAHPDRCKIYYEKNKARILAQQKARRKKQLNP